MASDLRLTLKITADGKAAVTEVQKLGGAVQRTGQEAKGAAQGVSLLNSSVGRLAAQAAGLVSIGVLANNFIAVNREAGRLRASLETVTGSVAAAEAAWARLEAFAATTPYTLDQSVTGFTRLKALGLDPSIEALRSYGDTASAMGKDLMQMVEAVADATTGEFERLKEFGIKARKEGETIAFTFRGVTTEVGNNAREIEGFLRSIGETAFAGGMARQMETLGGALSNLEDASDRFWRTLGDAGLSEAAINAVRGAIGGLESLSDWLRDDLPSAVYEAEAAFGGWGETLRTVAEAASWFGTAMVIGLREELGAEVRFIGESFLALPDNLTKAVHIILGEIDILIANFAAGFAQLGPIAAATWAEVEGWIAQALNRIKVAVADAVAFMAGKLAEAARGLADLAAAVPEWADLGGAAAASASALTGLAGALESTAGASAELRAEGEALAAQQAERLAGIQAEASQIEAARRAEVSAIRDVIQAGLDDVDAKAAQRQAQAELNREFAEAEAQFAALERQYADHAAAAGEAAAGANTLAGALGGGRGGRGGGVSKAAQDAARELKALDSTIESLVRRYLPAVAAAQDYAEAEAAVAAAVAATRLTQEQGAEILAKMREEQAKLTKDGKTEVDAWAEVWKNGIQRLDDAFAGLWADLFNGTRSTMESLKKLVLDWLAEVAHALLTKPLVVSITTALTGGASGVASAATGGGGGLGGLGSIGSLLSGNSIGSGLAGGMTRLGIGTGGGFWTGFGTNLINTPNWAFGLGGIAGGLLGSFLAKGPSGQIGSMLGSGAGTAIGAGLFGSVGGLVGGPLGAIAGALIGNAFGDKTEPRAQWIATSSGQGFEDDVFARSRVLGINFGLGGKSHEVEAEEYRAMLQTFAGVADAIGTALGPEVSRAIRDGINATTDQGKLSGLAMDGWSAEQAFQHLFGQIIGFAEDTGDTLAAVFAARVGELSGSVEEMAAQVARAAAELPVLVAMGDHYAALGRVLGETETASLMAVGALADLAGGIEALVAMEEFFFQNFYSETERLRVQFEDAQGKIVAFNDALGLTGEAMIDTRAELRAYVDGLDLTTEAGRAARIAALQLAPEILRLEEAIEGLGGSAGMSADAIRQAIATIDAALASVQQSFASTIESVRLRMMDEQEKHTYFARQAETIAAGIGELTDVDEILAAAGRINELVASALGTLSDEQLMRGMGDGIIAFLGEAEAVVTERLQALRAEREEELASLDGTLANAAAGFNSAAAGMQAAAAGMAAAAAAIPSQIAVNVTVSQPLSEVA